MIAASRVDQRIKEPVRLFSSQRLQRDDGTTIWKRSRVPGQEDARGAGHPRGQPPNGERRRLHVVENEYTARVSVPNGLQPFQQFASVPTQAAEAVAAGRIGGKQIVDSQPQRLEQAVLRDRE